MTSWQLRHATMGGETHPVLYLIHGCYLWSSNELLIYYPVKVEPQISTWRTDLVLVSIKVRASRAGHHRTSMIQPVHLPYETLNEISVQNKPLICVQIQSPAHSLFCLYRPTFACVLTYYISQLSSCISNNNISKVLNSELFIIHVWFHQAVVRQLVRGCTRSAPVLFPG